jgi:hypothetical protein
VFSLATTAHGHHSNRPHFALDVEQAVTQPFVLGTNRIGLAAAASAADGVREVNNSSRSRV